MKHVRGIRAELGGANIFFVEDVQYQKAAIQEMIRAMLAVVPMKPVNDKRSRLMIVAPYIKNGTRTISPERLCTSSLDSWSRALSCRRSTGLRGDFNIPHFDISTQRIPSL
jgi:hypothetical protein